jgi:hypothetical protein
MVQRQRRMMDTLESIAGVTVHNSRNIHQNFGDCGHAKPPTQIGFRHRPAGCPL